MKTKFKAYYPLKQEQKKAIFNSPDTYFIFDTNALLDIYRLGKTVSNKVIRLFKKYENQIKIPYHVAEEYHEHVYDIMIECDSLYSTLFEKITADYIIKLIEDNSKDLFKYEHLAKMLKKHIKKALIVFRNKITQEKNFISQQLETWELPDELADFLGDKVLEQFSEDEIRQIEEEGARRFGLKEPPGHEDSNKTNGNKYGDLIIWKEILKFAAAHPESSIVFVSRDLNKGDWQWILHGRKCGLHPHLLKEFQAISNGHILMYPLQDFINYANETGKVFNKEEIDTIQEIRLPDISKHVELWQRYINFDALKDIDFGNVKFDLSQSLQERNPEKKTPDVSVSPKEDK